ncbi:MAG: hypothetical protein HQK53_15995 [Oligoflexia bacterium]|nr:hypothetical protein [Oligoflexia bacterium]
MRWILLVLLFFVAKSAFGIQKVVVNDGDVVKIKLSSRELTRLAIEGGDCWAMSDWLFKHLRSVGIKVRIIEYATRYAKNHRSVQMLKGTWVDLPYRKYGINTMFRPTTSKPNMRVLASSYF